MTHPAVIVAAYCAFVAPAVDKVAGGFPGVLPVAVAVTVSDLVCAVVNPTIWGAVGVIVDVVQLRHDVSAKVSSPISKTLGMRR